MKIINLESGKSSKSFDLNSSHTGGNRAQSLSKVLNEVSRQTRVRLKRLYMITREIIEVKVSNNESMQKKKTIYELIMISNVLFLFCDLDKSF